MFVVDEIKDFGDVVYKYFILRYVGKDWDKVVVEIVKEEKEEKFEGEVVLN